MDQGTKRFVLVPVPAAHVLDVMRWLVYRDARRDEAAEWNETSLASVLAQLPGTSQAIVNRIADATLAEHALNLRALAAELGDDVKDVATAIQDINRRARDANLPELIDVQRHTETDDDGVEQPVFRLELAPGLAPLVTPAES
jgi:hypothetical protein